MAATSEGANGTPSRVSPKTLTSLPAILTSLSEIEALETSLSASLATLLASQQPIIEPLTRLQSLVPRIEELAADADLLSQKVGGTAKTAQRVGGRVRALDEEMRRVREASERVAAVTELKVRYSGPSWAKQMKRLTWCQTSLIDLYSSIASEDWEAATRHCARAMAVPPEIISGAFAESVVVCTMKSAKVVILQPDNRCSPLQIYRCLPPRPWRRPGRAFCRHSERTLQRLLVLVTQRTPVGSSSCFRPSDGRRKG